MMSTLKVGMVRYGVMCGVDGMVIDDGTVMRLAEDRFQVFTTTGGAAHILDWMEEWLQTEWPHLKVRLTSVTDQWATFPVVGPKSRDVVGAVFRDLDVSNDAFPFMAWRDTHLDGVPVRVARVSFSGELAFEVNVNAWHAPAVWDRLLAAGEKFDITPYGTETMHVLRAEKGYPIIGQDTDGTITPQDLGMDWAVSKKKPDFIGKRSFTRAENLNPMRKQFVGLLPLDRETGPTGGLADHRRSDGGILPPPPVPMLGHVTSSYRSAELGRPFGLALVKAGRSRIGDTLHVPVDGTLVAVEVTGSVLVDPKEHAAMADTLDRHKPAAALDREKFAQLPPTVTLEEEPFVTMVDLWADPDGPGAPAGVGHSRAGPADHAVHVCQQRHTDRHLDGAATSG